MSKPFLFGDSHARGMTDTVADGWHALGIGGATAHNLISLSSDTEAGPKIIECLDNSPGSKDIYMMFGDVDCANHLLSENMVEVTMARYREFTDGLRRRHDVSSVTMCRVYPRTSVFYMHGRNSTEIMEIIELWNSKMLSPIDTHGPLLGADGFLLQEFSHNAGDPGERHLSKIGIEAVWNVLISHHSAAAT